MSAAAVLAGIFVVHVLAMMSPGPNFLVVTQAAASRTRRAGVFTALGVAAGAALWAVAALLGLGVVYAQVGWLRRAVELIGGAYLLYLGIRLWRGAARPLPVVSNAVDVRGDWQAFGLGLATNLTNPKAVVFYAGLFAAFLTPELPQWLKWLAVLLIVVDAIGWHVALACLFSTPRARQAYSRARGAIDRSAGTLLALLGAWLLWPGR